MVKKTDEMPLYIYMRFGGFFSWTSESLVLKSAREEVDTEGKKVNL